MSAEKFPGSGEPEAGATESEPEKSNPNSIGEMLEMRGDIETTAASVYRSIRERAAIDDIFASGVVRNRQSAGLVEKSRWGERVFWSRGGEGKGINVGKGNYVIEAPYDVAAARAVTKEDLKSIYTRSEQGEVIDILPEERAKGTGQG